MAIAPSIVVVKPLVPQQSFKGRSRVRRKRTPSTSSVSRGLSGSIAWGSGSSVGGGRVAALGTTTVVLLMVLLCSSRQNGGGGGAVVSAFSCRAPFTATRTLKPRSTLPYLSRCSERSSSPFAPRGTFADLPSTKNPAPGHSSPTHKFRWSHPWSPLRYPSYYLSVSRRHHDNHERKRDCGAAATLMVATDGSLSSKLSITPPAPEQPSGAIVPVPTQAGGGVVGDARDTPVPNEQARQRLKVAMFFLFWYTFNVGYNLCTKFTLNVLQLPMTLAALQMLVGVPYVWCVWLAGLRKAPRIGLSQVRGTIPVATAHTMAHLGAVVSIGAGAVGFVQVVKAAEPLFTAALSFLTGSAMPLPVYLTLLPVIGGVTMASVGEISFSVLAFAAAMTSNASAASRSVLGKKFLAKTDKEDRMDAGNLYAVMTMLGCLVLTPLAVVTEGSRIAAVWAAAVSAGHTPSRLITNGLLSGLFFYLYNEVSFYALNAIHPVTHALGNTLKRVVMIAVSVVVFQHTFTPLGLLGCCTAIGGVMAYSVTKAKLQSSAATGPTAASAAIDDTVTSSPAEACASAPDPDEATAAATTQ